MAVANQNRLNAANQASVEPRQNVAAPTKSDPYALKPAIEDLKHLKAKVSSKIKNLLYACTPFNSQKAYSNRSLTIKDEMIEKLHAQGVYKPAKRLEEISIAKWADHSLFGLTKFLTQKTEFDLTTIYNNNLMSDRMAYDMAMSKQNIQFELNGKRYNLCPKIMGNTDDSRAKVRWILMGFSGDSNHVLVSSDVHESFQVVMSGLFKNPQTQRVNEPNEQIKARVIRQYSFGTFKKTLKKALNVKKYQTHPELLKTIADLDFAQIMNPNSPNQPPRPNDPVNYGHLKQMIAFIGGQDVFKTEEDLKEFVLLNASSIFKIIKKEKMSMVELENHFFKTSFSKASTDLHAYDLSAVNKATGAKINKDNNKRSNGDAVALLIAENIEASLFEEDANASVIPFARAESFKTRNPDVDQNAEEGEDLIRAHYDDPTNQGNRANLPRQESKGEYLDKELHQKITAKKRPIIFVRGSESFQIVSELDHATGKYNVFALSLHEPNAVRQQIGALSRAAHITNVLEKKDAQQLQVQEIQRMISGFRQGKPLHALLDTANADAEIKRDVLRFSKKRKIKNASSSLMAQIKRDTAEWSVERKAEALERLVELEKEREARYQAKLRDDANTPLIRFAKKMWLFSARYQSTRNMCSALAKAVMNGEDLMYRFRGHLFAGATQPQDTIGSHTVRSLFTQQKDAAAKDAWAINFNKSEFQAVAALALDPTFQILGDAVQELASNGFVAQSDRVVKGKGTDYSVLKQKQKTIEDTVKHFVAESEKISKLLSGEAGEDALPQIITFMGEAFDSREKLLKKFSTVMMGIVFQSMDHADLCGAKSDFNMSKFVFEQLSQNMVRAVWLATLYAGAPAILADVFHLSDTSAHRLPDLTGRRILQTLAGGLDNFMRFRFIIKDHANKPTQIMSPAFKKYRLDLWISRLPTEDIDRMVSEVVGFEGLNAEIPQKDGTVLKLGSHHIQALYRLTHPDATRQDTKQNDLKLLKQFVTDPNNISQAELQNLWERTKVCLIYELDGLRSIRQEYSTQRMALANNVLNQEAGDLKVKIQFARAQIDSYTDPDGKNYISPDDSEKVQALKRRKLAEISCKYNRLMQKEKELARKALLFSRGVAYAQSCSNNKFNMPDLTFGTNIDPSWENAWDQLAQEFPDSTIDKALRTGGEEWLRSTKTILKNFGYMMKSPNTLLMETAFRSSHVLISGFSLADDALSASKDLHMIDKLQYENVNIDKDGAPTEFSMGGTMLHVLSFTVGISSAVGIYFDNMTNSNYDRMSGEGLNMVLSSINNLVSNGAFKLREKETARKKLEEEFANASTQRKIEIRAEVEEIIKEHRLMRIEIAKLLSLRECYARQQETKNAILALTQPIRYNQEVITSLQNGTISEQKLNELVSDASSLSDHLSYESSGFKIAGAPLLTSANQESLEGLAARRELSKGICTHFAGEMAALQVKALGGDPHQLLTGSGSKKKKSMLRSAAEFLFIKPQTRSVTGFYEQSIFSFPETLVRKVGWKANKAWHRHVLKQDVYAMTSRKSVFSDRDSAKAAQKMHQITEHIVENNQTPKEVLGCIFETLYLYQKGSTQAKNMGRERDGMAHLRMHFMQKAETDLELLRKQIIALKIKKQKHEKLTAQDQATLDNSIYLESEYREFFLSDAVQRFKAYHKPIETLNLVDDAKFHQFYGKASVNQSGSYSLRYANSFPACTIPDWNEGAVGKTVRTIKNSGKLLMSTLSSLISPNHKASIFVSLVGVWYRDHFLWTRVVRTVAAVVFATARMIKLAVIRHKTRKETAEMILTPENEELRKKAMNTRQEAISSRVAKVLPIIHGERLDNNAEKLFSQSLNDEGFMIALSGVISNDEDYEDDLDAGNTEEKQMQAMLRKDSQSQSIQLIKYLNDTFKLNSQMSLLAHARMASTQKTNAQNQTQSFRRLDEFIMDAIDSQFADAGLNVFQKQKIQEKTQAMFYVQLALEEMRQVYINLEESLLNDVETKIFEEEQRIGRRLLASEEEELRAYHLKAFKKGKYAYKENKEIQAIENQIQSLTSKYNEEYLEIIRKCAHLQQDSLGDANARAQIKLKYKQLKADELAAQAA